MHRPIPALLVLIVPWLIGGSCIPARPLPVLLASTPSAGATVARTAWPVLDFATAVEPDAPASITLLCDDQFVGSWKYLLDADSIVVQPKAELPAGANCQLAFPTTAGAESVAFQTAAAAAAFVPRYDRRDHDQPLPFPDDFFLAPDASAVTGFQLDLILPGTTGTAGSLLGNVAAVATATSDGWSPLGNWSLQVSNAAAGSSMPGDRSASVDPLSSVALLDLTPGSPSFGERVPFTLIARSDTFPPEPISHNIILFPGIALEPGGTYGVVMTDRVLDGAGEPLGRSAFFDAVVAPPAPGEAAEIAKARPLAEEVLAVAESLSPVPIPRRDVAAAVRITVRSTAHFPDDLLAMRAAVLGTLPDVQIETTVPGPSNVAAIVEGTFQVPQWGTNAFVDRGADGLPEAIGTQRVDFILALPDAAATTGRAPLLMYQHGSPGSAQNEVPNATSGFLGAAGFAVGGFTDPLNRVAPTTDEASLAILANVLISGEAPDFYIRAYAEQMAFVRALQSLDTLDLLPLGAPDGVPDVDPSTLVYEGISYGSNHAQAFLAYEPAIRAAALVAGAVRFAELIEYQDRTQPQGIALIRDVLGGFLTGVRAPDFWMALSLFAVTYDRQDPHNHARFIYRDPLSIDGVTRKASLLVVEGIDDSFTSNNSTRSLARQLGGIPQLTPAPVPVVDLTGLAGPIQANIDVETTAAMVQYVPNGSEPPPSTGCPFQFEGHFCAQTAPEARAQRVDFYQSALVGVPVIDE